MTHVVLVGIDGLRVEAVFAFLLALFDVLTDPDVAVQAEDEVHAARERDEVRLEPPDERRRDRHELAVAQLGVA